MSERNPDSPRKIAELFCECGKRTVVYTREHAVKFTCSECYSPRATQPRRPRRARG